jgi:hypothetical protein
MIKLLNDVNQNTTGTGIETDGSSKTLLVWVTAVTGSFGGGSVTIEASGDNGTTWIPLTIGGNVVAFTANAVEAIDYLGQNMFIRASLSGATNPLHVNAAIF